jgi:isoleucyl-tRNA synthetase
VCSAASSIRKAKGLAARQPLSRLLVAAPDAGALEPFLELIGDEANVKTVDLTTDVASAGEFVLQLVPAVLGPRVGKDVQRLIAAVKAGEWSREGETVVVAGREMADDEYTMRLVARDDASAPLPGNVGVVALDLELTPALVSEGTARWIVRGVNDARRTEGLHVSDRIHLVLFTDHDDVRAAIDQHKDFIARETLANELVVADDRPVDGHRIPLADERVLYAALSVTS